ncbi:MAG: efflux RND transporter periplasmic adaptor subunit [Candidatus Sulfotelmatobacter sp.]
MRTATTESNQEFTQVLGAHLKSSRRATYARWLALAVMLPVMVAVLLHRARGQNAGPQYETQPVTRGTLRVAVSATGNLEPTNKVNVGSELSGTIETVTVQQNDHVTRGQVLACLDVSKLRDAVNKSQAALESAQAKLAQAQATVKLDSATLDRYREVSRLSGGKVPSKTEMESAEATLARAEADEQSARADVDQARASLNSDQTNVSKASIRSPVNGVVLSRGVEPGQTVAASLEVATLFTVAEDLRQMELKVDVDEADVGTVRAGQAATFTVAAYPDRPYSAKVTRVAYGSQTKENVVSYSTVLKVKNDDLSLRPGMTATAEIATVTRENALLVPNSALRFTPSTTSPQAGRSLLGRLMPVPPPDHSTKQAVPKGNGSAQQVWATRNGEAMAVSVTIGVTDGKFTEIVSGNLQVGMQVITDSITPAK